MTDKRQKILDATAEMIVEYGLQACPMSKISARAGCGAGTIYRYFETKQELVVALFEDRTKRITDACLDEYNHTSPLRQRFVALWGGYYQYILANPCDRALLEQLLSSPMICCNERDSALGRLHEATYQLLDEGKREGVFKELPNEVLSTVTYGSLSMMAKKLDQVPEKFNDKVCTETVLDLCWDALRR